MVTGANFSGTTSTGFTKEQLYSTASYQAKNLTGIGLGQNDLSGWDFSGQNLTNADLYNSTLTNANLSGANLTNANMLGVDAHERQPERGGGDGGKLRDTTSHGFTKEQLYSTASYQAKNLAGIDLESNDLSGWDFSGQNWLTGGQFLVATTPHGFTKEQLYSTASYQAKQPVRNRASEATTSAVGTSAGRW